MREQLRARITRMANEIAQRWENEGQSIREFGSRDGDNDRCDMGDEIWATLTENVSLGEDPDIISETLTEWHKAREQEVTDPEQTQEDKDMSRQEWDRYATEHGIEESDTSEWDIETLREWALEEIKTASDIDEWEGITQSMIAWVFNQISEDEVAEILDEVAMQQASQLMECGTRDIAGVLMRGCKPMRDMSKDELAREWASTNGYMWDDEE